MTQQSDLSIWRDFYRDTVTIEPFSSQDSHGQPAYGDPVTYTARVVGKVRQVRDVNGLERVSTATTYILDTVALTPRDRITLPSRFSPTQPNILSIAQEPDERGWHHTVVYT